MTVQAVIDPQNPDLYTNVNAVAWSPDGSLLALGSGFWGVPEGIEDYRVRVVNVATQQVIFTLPFLDRARLMWSPSGVLAVGLEAEGRLTLPPYNNPIGILATLTTVPPLPASRQV